MGMRKKYCLSCGKVRPKEEGSDSAAKANPTRVWFPFGEFTVSICGYCIAKMLLPNWEVMPAKQWKKFGCPHDGRDYYKSVFIRKDNYALIYHNVDPCVPFAIVFANGDGEAADSIIEAIKKADEYIIAHESEFKSINNPRSQLF